MKQPRFIDLPRHKRRDIVIRVKNYIRQQNGKPSSLFWTDYDWDNHLKSGGGFFYLSFLGSNPWTYWWACFYTKKAALESILDDMADREFRRQISEEDRQFYDEALSDCFRMDKSKAWTMLDNAKLDKLDMPLSSLGGLSVTDFTKQARHRLEKNPPQIYEEFWVKKDYPAGIGLSAIIDTEILDVPSVESAIKRFLAQGEKSSFPNGRLKSQLIL